MAMEMSARRGFPALPPMDEAALGGPESVEQPRALLHVVAQAEEIGDEKEYPAARFATEARGETAPPLLLFTCGYVLVKVPRLVAPAGESKLSFISRGHQ